MTHNRKLLDGLFFEKNGDLNLSQLLMIIMGLAGIFGFIYQLVIPKANVVQILAGWSFLAGAFVAVLIAAIPLAKAKILANAKLPGEMAGGIESLIKNSTASSDIQELTQKTNQVG